MSSNSIRFNASTSLCLADDTVALQRFNSLHASTENPRQDDRNYSSTALGDELRNGAPTDTFDRFLPEIRQFNVDLIESYWRSLPAGEQSSNFLERLPPNRVNWIVNDSPT